MIPRHRLVDDPIQTIAQRLTALGCSPSQVAHHIQQLSRKRPEARHQHLSEIDGKWLHQLRERPLLDEKAFQEVWCIKA
jgi:hypothetical protein